MGSGSILPVDKRFGIDEHHVILMRSALPIDTATADAYGIFAGPSVDSAPAMTPHGRVVHPTIPSYSIRYGFSDQSIRGYSGASKASPVPFPLCVLAIIAPDADRPRGTGLVHCGAVIRCRSDLYFADSLRLSQPRRSAHRLADPDRWTLDAVVGDYKAHSGHDFARARGHSHRPLC
jgi:hypothetical protein